MSYFLTLFLFFTSTQSLAADKNLTLALNWKAEPEFGGFYAAQFLKEFSKRGLNVHIQEGGSGTPTVQMLTNSRVDFAIVSADELLISLDRNPKKKIKALFAVYQTAPYIIMTHSERKFNSLEDVFKSTGTLSLQAGLPYYLFLKKKFGAPKAQIVPYLGGVSHFLKDKNFSQQGFITIEPLSAEKAGAKTKNFLVSKEGFNPYTVVVAAREDTLKSDPESAKKFIEAIHAGWDVYLKNPGPTNKLIAELNKSFDYETLEAAARVQIPLIEVTMNGKKEIGKMTKKRWRELETQLIDLGLIKAKNADDVIWTAP